MAVLRGVFWKHNLGLNASIGNDEVGTPMMKGPAMSFRAQRSGQRCAADAKPRD
jgi:hypothetical protein